MKFIKQIRERLGLTHYKLGQELNHPVQSIEKLEKSGVFIKPSLLCKLRKLSGLSWSKFGKLLDDEFLKGGE